MAYCNDIVNRQERALSEWVSKYGLQLRIASLTAWSIENVGEVLIKCPHFEDIIRIPIPYDGEDKIADTIVHRVKSKCWQCGAKIRKDYFSRNPFDPAYEKEE